jgi:hypothetical protein
MTAGKLQDLLIARLIRAAGGSARTWRLALGPIRIRPAATHVHCNWEFSASGSVREVAAIERLLDDVRLDRPFVTAD